MNKLKRIHINRQTIARNKKKGENEPIIGVEESGVPKVYGHHVYIDGPSTIMYRKDKPLKCGATVWIETRAPVAVITDAQ